MDENLHPDNPSDQPTPEIDKYRFQVTEEIRRFEIGLLWQRAGYFWGFTTVTLGGYVLLKSNTNVNPLYPVFVACFGLISAIGWTLSSRGSKFWFHVWEYKAEQAAERVFGTRVWEWSKGVAKRPAAIEDTYAQSLYGFSTKLHDKIQEDDGNKGWYVRRFSVTRLSIMISDYVVILWVLALVMDVLLEFKLQLAQIEAPAMCVAIAVTIAYSIYMYWQGNSERRK